MAGILEQLYTQLMELYGPQGWWPLYDGRKRAVVYRPGRYGPPQDGRARFEIALGVILTQNTTWESAVKALDALRLAGPLTPQAMLSADPARLEALIRPARYPVQKTRYIRAVAEFFLHKRPGLSRIPSRGLLLSIKGIGPESADSLLLYAFGRPAFIADAYSRRILAALGYVSRESGYEAVRLWAEERLPADTALLNELHALLVEHGSRFYSRQPYGRGDVLPERMRISGHRRRQSR